MNSDGVCAAIVADGLGGHGGGQIASGIAANSIFNMFRREPRIEAEYIRQLFERANQDVLSAQTAQLKMKSTGVALFINKTAAVWGHVGDSRLYCFQDGTLSHQTTDHSVSQMAVFAGEIKKEQIRFHPDRNKVLRAFGGSESLKPEISSVHTLTVGFYAFLLCTDGFWEYVREPEMEIELAKAGAPSDWLQGMIQRLAGRVPKNHDNFSAVSIFISGDDKKDEE